MTPSDIRAALEVLRRDWATIEQSDGTFKIDYIGFMNAVAGEIYTIEQALRFMEAAIEVKYDNALNDASWTMNDELTKLGEVSAKQFNFLKPALREAILKWTTALLEQIKGE